MLLSAAFYLCGEDRNTDDWTTYSLMMIKSGSWTQVGKGSLLSPQDPCLVSATEPKALPRSQNDLVHSVNHPGQCQIKLVHLKYYSDSKRVCIHMWLDTDVIDGGGTQFKDAPGTHTVPYNVGQLHLFHCKWGQRDRSSPKCLSSFRSYSAINYANFFTAQCKQELQI